MNPIKAFLSFLFIIFSPALIVSQNSNRVSVIQETQVLSKGSRSVFKSEIFFDKEKEIVVVHHTSPAEFVKISNRFGEMKIYFPATNSVSVQQNQAFSSTNELIYYFVNNKINDLGLSKEGFQLVSTSREEGMMVTEWQAPVGLKTFNRVKMVFSELRPVYAEYIGLKGEIRKKIYYGKYSDFKTFSLPQRITEITFESEKDSTIRLSKFSDVRTGDFTEKSYFDFKIPGDAKDTR